MPEVVNPELRRDEAADVADGVRVRRFQFVTRSGPPTASGNTSPKRRTVARYSRRIGARNPGSTIDRDACVFGVTDDDAAADLGDGIGDPDPPS